MFANRLFRSAEQENEFGYKIVAVVANRTSRFVGLAFICACKSGFRFLSYSAIKKLPAPILFLQREKFKYSTALSGTPAPSVTSATFPTNVCHIKRKINIKNAKLYENRGGTKAFIWSLNMTSSIYFPLTSLIIAFTVLNNRYLHHKTHAPLRDIITFFYLDFN